jgi:glucokinase
MPGPEHPAAIGVDVGGTKIAAGLVTVPDGRVVARTTRPTLPTRGGKAILADVIAAIEHLRSEAERLRLSLCGIGLGVAELVDARGRIVSNATLDWQDRDVLAAFEGGLPACCEADVRCAALAEARVGAGRGQRSFLYITIGTGISSCLVLDGRPYAGTRGLSGTMASQRMVFPDRAGCLIDAPPLEHYASGPALAARFKAVRPEFNGDTPAVCKLAAGGDDAARHIVETAGRALGSAIGHLMNVLDPESVLLGGGLGLAGGLFERSLISAAREHLWSPLLQSVPILAAQTGAEAGLIGAALAAADRFTFA